MTYNEALHKRGTGAQGGQFVTKGAGGQTTTSSHIGYDGKGRGTGYGTGGDPNVSALQKELNRLGIVDGQGNQLKVDGKFGPKTTAAVRRLQARLGLAVDGKVTPALLAKLKKMTPSKHDQHAMHVRHLAAQHKQHTAHQAHVQHQKAAKKATPAPAKKAAPRKRARTGMGSNPRAKSAAQKPSQSARDAAARKNSVTRSVGYSRPMTYVERHLPGGHNQQSHANRVGNVLAPSKGLGKDFHKKPREFSTADVQNILVDKKFGGGTEHRPANSASRKTEDHVKRLTDAGATQDQAHQIVKDLGMDPVNRPWETKDPAYALYHRVENEKKSKAEAERRTFLAGKTPGVYARLLGNDGQPALVKSKPVRAVFEAMQGAGWMMTAASSHGTYSFSSADGSRMINVIAINGVTIYDDRHNKISGVKALAYVRGT